MGAWPRRSDRHRSARRRRGRVRSSARGPARCRPRTASSSPPRRVLRLPHTDDSLTAGGRGPTLMEDFHLREKVMHFDHERIPERVVHAAGRGAHGVFEAYGDGGERSPAPASSRPGGRTPVFTRFSTVVGSRGSADTVRDVRGFAVKFYTDEGVFDLVGNNIPVFFIRDGIKFPDLIHAAKPEPDRRDPAGADRAHDVLGLRVADPRVAAHAHVGDVGPGHPTLLPDDGGLRRPHVPPRQRRRRRRRW